MKVLFLLAFIFGWFFVSAWLGAGIAISGCLQYGSYEHAFLKVRVECRVAAQEKA